MFAYPRSAVSGKEDVAVRYFAIHDCALAASIRFGIALQGDKTPSEYVAHAELIDRYPFAVVSVYNDLFFQPALGPLLLMAPYLRSAQLGPAALNPYTLHPIEIAGQTAVLDLVTDGR